ADLSQGLLVTLAQNASADPMATLSSGAEVFVPTTTARVAASAGTQTELVALRPQGGAGALAFPLVTLSPDQAAGVAALAELVQSPQAASVLQAAGFEPGEEGADPPEAAAVAQLQRRWEELQPPSRLLAVIDVSGSMDEQVGDTTRIGITSQAAQQGLGLFPDDSAVGLWAFSTDRGPEGQDYAEILPVRPLAQQVDGLTQRDLLAQASA